MGCQSHRLRTAGMTLALVCSVWPAAAKPPAANGLCQAYPASPHCVGRTVSCYACHTAPPSLNAYGTSVSGKLAEAGYTFTPREEETQFMALLPAALSSVEAVDSDADGVSNVDELLRGTMPGDAASNYTAVAPSNAWDPRFAYRRASVVFCGAPPTYDELQAVPEDPTAGRAAVQTLLDTCLASSFWRNEQLHRMADSRIRPQHAVGYDRGNEFSLGDYRFDYRLFSYVMSGDRDARDLLRATYHVDENGFRVDGAFNAPGVGGNLGEPLQPDKRAGMITTTWFLAIHTMFSPLPRTSAA